MNTLINERGRLKGKLTRFTTYVNNLYDLRNSEVPITSKDICQLKRRSENASALLAEYEVVYQKITEASEASNDEADDLLTIFENEYHEQLSAADALLSELTPNDNDTLPGSPTASISSANSNLSLNKINLPKINLIKFDGQVDNWLEFKAIFESLIHNNVSLSDINKLHYLKASLQKDPSDIIKSLDFTSENYTVAWEAIKSRYDQPRLILKNNLSAIINLKSVKQESSKDIRKVCDTLSKHVTSALSLATPEQLFDAIIVYLISNKLDQSTFREWEILANKISNDLPSLKEFKEFLINHSNFLESIESRSSKSYSEKSKVISKSFVAKISICSYCKEEHFIALCPEFAKLTAQSRSDKAQELRLCFNCLSNNHISKDCLSKFTCRMCKGKHHSLLHGYTRVTALVQPEVIETEENAQEEPIQTISTFCSNTLQVLLPTATAKVRDNVGINRQVRILLDSGSQSCFMTTKFRNQLNLPVKTANITVCGINNSNSPIKSQCEVEVSANHSSFKIKLTCLIIDNITGSVPSFKVNSKYLKIPDNIVLSDPSFNQPGEIDLLIGSPAFFKLLCVGQRSLGPNLPLLQQTHLGWVVAGPTTTALTNQVQCHLSTLDVQDQIAKFWEIESYPEEKVFSAEEKACEAHFVQNTLRNSEGRFIVTIPFKDSLDLLGDSSFVARKRFLSLERRLQVNTELQKRYIAFMQEYLDLNHMSLASTPCEISYYLPHHGVLKEDSLTTKLRVVFNGSSATTTGHSLNSLQMVGPTIQQSLFTILLRFRQHLYAISADIEKMYRQVLINPDQRPLQRILWRSSVEQPLSTYDLNTVTYGTTAASFLAIRSLFQLGIECEISSPVISSIIKNDFYVDDLLSGADNIDDAKRICTELNEVLSAGCFKLRKWISNDPLVLGDIPKSDFRPGLLNFGDREQARTLGLIWNFQTDHFMFQISKLEDEKITKRKMLSDISQIFDPIGLVAPSTIIAKFFLQGLWLEKLDWDDAVPVELEKKWISYRQDLLNLNDLKIPRHVTCANPTNVQIHGFCDASLNGYGACIYFRITDSNNFIHVNLFCSKSKVAPLKPTTIPRLELCGAVLLSKLLKQVRKSLIMPVDKYFLWSDSTIVLGWLKTNPNLLKTFVCNRIADIQEHTTDVEWRHISTKFNPADLLSRGVTPQVLKTSNLWWYGPSWLSQEEISWPITKIKSSDLPECKGISNVLIVNNQNSFPFENYSNLNKLERTVAYCLRFRKNCSLSKGQRTVGPLSPDELFCSLQTLIKLSQQESFFEERKQLLKNQHLKITSSILSLNPFLDSDNLIRVGGRLINSNYSFNKKHPFLICGKHYLSKLIVRREHLRLLHAGPQLLLCSLRDKFWITAGRNLVKNIVHNCVTCFRASPPVTRPIMGNLPLDRITYSQPFNVTGIDYAGPILYKRNKGRGSKTEKSYLCIFICFASKAIHLELVTDLSTDVFILALRRFISRRGKPSHIHSDNGTNFVGANSKLRELGKFLKDQKNSIVETFSSEGITWHFIPAHSPHFGGLWESGVKSSKSHLKRILGTSIFTFEELCTLLCQIEAILNSRPIAPLSSDPNDLQPLTPGHFLIGRALTSLPDPDVTGIPDNRLDYFQRIQSLHQHFWRRWSKEYISELQQRTKWKNHHSDLIDGSLVLVKDDNLPPFKWKLGRVISLHPGTDNVNRVATLRTAGGLIRRSFAKICPLPSS